MLKAVDTIENNTVIFKIKFITWLFLYIFYTFLIKFYIIISIGIYKLINLNKERKINNQKWKIIVVINMSR